MKNMLIKNQVEFIELTHLFKFRGTERTTTDSKFATYEEYEETKSHITF
jgi:hypothetical protein